MNRNRSALFLLALLLTVSLLLPACQTSSDSGGSTTPQPEAPTGDEGAAPTEDAAEPAGNGQDADLTIWDWNGDIQLEFAAEFNKTYPDVSIAVQAVAWDDYMTKLQTSYVTGLELPDIIFGEIAWRGSLFEMGVCENLEQAPYNLDRSQMVSSSIPLTTDPAGNIVALEMQVTPAGFAYKRDLAKQYLGTDDPAEVGALIADWDAFLETGLQVLESSGGQVKMMASLGDVLLSALSQNVVDYVDGGAVDITKKMSRPLEITLQMRDAGVTGSIEMYSASWYAAYASDEYLFYEAAAWCPPYVITVNDPDGAGNWAITTPPGGSFNLGGTSLSINKDSESKEAAWQFLEYVYFSEEGGALMYDLTGNYSCYQPYYEGEYSPFNLEGPHDAFFGGQSLVEFYIGTAAPQAETAVQTRFDSIVDATFQKLTPVYMSDSSIDAAEALALFIEEVELKDMDADVI